MNQERNFTNIIQEICTEENIDLNSFSYDWIFELKKNDKVRYILGYQFGLNSGSVQSICADKAAMSEILSSHKIPNVEHSFFMAPTNQKYVSKDGNWKELSRLLQKYKKLVCKPNSGSGGNSVYKVTNSFELEEASYHIFSKNRSMAVSPFYDISHEYRVVCLNNSAELIIKKERPNVIGDGKKTVRELVSENIADSLNNLLLDEFSFKGDLNKVLKKSHKLDISWKHNLGKGASGIKLNAFDEKYEELSKFAKKVCDALNIKFASVDIAQIGPELKIMEINSGVMLEHFSKQSSDDFLAAKNIYKKAILEMLK